MILGEKVRSSKVCPTKTKALPETKKTKDQRGVPQGQNTWLTVPKRWGFIQGLYVHQYKGTVPSTFYPWCNLFHHLVFHPPGLNTPPRNMRLRTGWLCLLGIALLGESTSQEVKSEEEPRLAMHGLWKASCEGLGQNIGLVGDRLPSSKPTNIFHFHLKVA